MYSFNNDYSEGAHPQIIDALCRSNMEQTGGYSEDCYTQRAVLLIKGHLKNEDVDVHILSGGTQVNLTAISAFLRPHQAVVCVESGHINVHETGAIEATGHKVLTVPTLDGKITPRLIESVLALHDNEHMVQPKLVYISNSTELGTHYKKAELVEISNCCKKNGLLLFLDGARLGSALCSVENDLTLEDIGKLVDSFYIGGTKNGALFGEALVICNNLLKEDFRYFIKQKGGLLAKGRLLGIQFEELFRDNLFFDVAIHANKMALLIKDALVEKGVCFVTDSYTNQQFPIFPNSLIEKLSQKYLFSINKSETDTTSSIRLVTSWATDEAKVMEFIGDLVQGTL